MGSRKLPYETLSVVGLVILALAAAILSGAALLRNRTVEAAPSTTSTSTLTPVTSPAPAPLPTTSDIPVATAEAEVSIAPDEAQTFASANAHRAIVVVIGDGNSLDEEAPTWVDLAAGVLQWGEVTNLSSPGRGFYATPRSCNLSSCSTFGGSIELITEAKPDVVITFGGAADGDVALGEAASSYFDSLREALPDADLIAISPVTGADEWPYFMTMHQQSIRAAVEGVGGTMIDVGRVGLGEDPLSAESHAEIAQIVVDELE